MTNLFGFEVVLIVVVPQSAVASLAPSEEGPLVGDASTVGRATGGVHHKVTAKVVHQVGALQVAGREVDTVIAATTDVAVMWVCCVMLL